MTAWGTTLYWDFFGPRAQGTATHFLEHLKQFLHREQVAHNATGVTELSPAHYAVWCTLPQENAARIQPVLKSRRSIPVEEAPHD